MFNLICIFTIIQFTHIQGKPFQEVIHFPLGPRLEALMKCEAYWFNLGYESWRPQPKDGIVADVYDCEQWKSTFESAPPLNSPKIGSVKVLFCCDGVDINSTAWCAKSVVPAEFIVLSLPPWERYKTKNILISMLLPDGLSGKQYKKFFDKVIETDYLPLFTEGIKDSLGNKVQVEIFGQVS